MASSLSPGTAEWNFSVRDGMAVLLTCTPDATECVKTRFSGAICLSAVVYLALFPRRRLV